MKGDVVNYWRVVFGEVDTKYLTVPTCRKTCPLHTAVLYFEDQYMFDASAIKGHKIFTSHAPYFLLVHDCKFFMNRLSSFFVRIFVGMIPGFVECLGFFKYRLGVVGHHG